MIKDKDNKANLEVIAIMGTLVRSLSRIDNIHPNALNNIDKIRLSKGKETLSKWCKIDPKDMPQPQTND